MSRIGTKKDIKHKSSANLLNVTPHKGLSQKGSVVQQDLERLRRQGVENEAAGRELITVDTSDINIVGSIKKKRTRNDNKVSVSDSAGYIRNTNETN